MCHQAEKTKLKTLNGRILFWRIYLFLCHTKTDTERDRQTDRERETVRVRQTDRQTDRKR